MPVASRLDADIDERDAARFDGLDRWGQAGASPLGVPTQSEGARGL
jgi:hypothetical protein